MRVRIDGREEELHTPSGVAVHRLGDRLIVRGPNGATSAAVARQGEATLVSVGGRTFRIEKAAGRATESAAPSAGEFRAPMPGQVVAVLVANGEKVVEGQKLLILEAMKTQQTIAAPYDGIVEGLSVEAGAQVREGDLLARVEKSPTP